MTNLSLAGARLSSIRLSLDQMQSFQGHPDRDEDAEAEERELARMEDEVRWIAQGIESDVRECDTYLQRIRKVPRDQRWASAQHWSTICRDVVETLRQTKGLLTLIGEMLGRSTQPDAYQIAAKVMEQIRTLEESLQRAEEALHQLTMQSHGTSIGVPGNSAISRNSQSSSGGGGSACAGCLPADKAHAAQIRLRLLKNKRLVRRAIRASQSPCSRLRIQNALNPSRGRSDTRLS